VEAARRRVSWLIGFFEEVLKALGAVGLVDVELLYLLEEDFHLLAVFNVPLRYGFLEVSVHDV
jgi:hypothetical protein